MSNSCHPWCAVLPTGPDTVVARWCGRSALPSHETGLSHSAVQGRTGAEACLPLRLCRVTPLNFEVRLMGPLRPSASCSSVAGGALPAAACPTQRHSLSELACAWASVYGLQAKDCELALFTGHCHLMMPPGMTGQLAAAEDHQSSA